MYGFADAPLIFSWVVRSRMYQAGFISHSLDVMAFLFYKTGVLVCMAIVHVDDFLFTASPTFDLKILIDLFTWGSLTMAPEEITFLNRQIIRVGPSSVKVHQSAYISSIKTRKPQRGVADVPLHKEGITEYLSCTGEGQFLASHSRPDIAADISLAQRQKPTHADLAIIYETLDYVKESIGAGIILKGLPLSLADTIVVTYGDSSWANAPGMKSQAGCLVALTTTEALRRESDASYADHQSSRTQRVVRSTLSGEAIAADNAVDRGTYVATYWQEIITGTPCYNEKLQIPLYLVTDCKSLYDCIVAVSPNLSEKRTLIDIMSIKQGVTPSMMRWVPTWAMLADGLTKRDRKLRLAFAKWLADPRIALVEDLPHSSTGATTVSKKQKFSTLGDGPANWYEELWGLFKKYAPEQLNRFYDIVAKYEAHKDGLQLLHHTLLDKYEGVAQSRTSNKDLPKDVCRHCHKRGHWGNECPNKLSGIQEGRFGPNYVHLALRSRGMVSSSDQAASSSSLPPREWIGARPPTPPPWREPVTLVPKPVAKPVKFKYPFPWTTEADRELAGDAGLQVLQRGGSILEACEAATAELFAKADARDTANVWIRPPDRSPPRKKKTHAEGRDRNPPCRKKPRLMLVE